MLCASPGDGVSPGAMSLGDVVRIAPRSGGCGSDVAVRCCARRLALRVEGMRRRLAMSGWPGVDVVSDVAAPGRDIAGDVGRRVAWRCGSWGGDVAWRRRTPRGPRTSPATSPGATAMSLAARGLALGSLAQSPWSRAMSPGQAATSRATCAHRLARHVGGGRCRWRRLWPSGASQRSLATSRRSAATSRATRAHRLASHVGGRRCRWRRLWPAG